MHIPASLVRVVHYTFPSHDRVGRKGERLRVSEQGRVEAGLLDDLRAAIARIERSGAAADPRTALPFGHVAIDGALPSGGLALGALHEVAGTGPDVEHGTAAALFVAGVLARLSGTVLWVLERHDLFAPALAGVGLHPARVLHADVGRSAAVLLVMEEGLRHRGLAGVVGEISGRLTLTASRRLQLAAEASGAIAIALRRSRKHDDPALAEPSAAVTRWRIAVMGSGGVRCAGSSRCGCRHGPPTGCAGSAVCLRLRFRS